MNYIDTFIAVAEDSPTRKSIVPNTRDGKRTIAFIQYEMLFDRPYQHTQEDVLFLTHVQHKKITDAELKAHGKEMREKFFAKPQACLRTSPLARKHGWGFHFDKNGKVALYAVESKEYKKFERTATKVLKALRTSRA